MAVELAIVSNLLEALEGLVERHRLLRFTRFLTTLVERRILLSVATIRQENDSNIQVSVRQVRLRWHRAIGYDERFVLMHGAKRLEQSHYEVSDGKSYCYAFKVRPGREDGIERKKEGKERRVRAC